MNISPGCWLPCRKQDFVIKTPVRITLLSALTLLVSGCFFGNYDSEKRYLEAEEIPDVVVPETLDSPVFVDHMEVPPVKDSRGIAGRAIDLSLPQALSTTYGVEQVVLKKLGEERWIFLDAPPATVWPKIIRFWQEHNLGIERIDPRTGVVESVWVPSQDGDADAIFDSISNRIAFRSALMTQQNRFRLRIEPGIRSGSSEVYLEHRQAGLTLAGAPGDVRWTGTSDNPELESKVLTRLAYYLGERINDPVISAMAIENRAEKALLVPDRVKPILRYRLDFDRAWATVGDALRSAEVAVEDLNRDDHVYFVYYDQTQRTRPGFLSRLFSLGRSGKAEKSDSHRFIVRLDDEPDAIAVSVLKDASTPADPQTAERLLKVIKESST